MNLFKQNKTLKLTLILTVIIVLSVGCLPDRQVGATKDQIQSTTEEILPVPVETMTISTSDISEKTYTFGYLETKESYFVTPQGGGIVDEIFVSTGDYVKSGDLLYQLEGEDLALTEERDMLQQNSSISNAKGSMDSLAVSLNQSEIDVSSKLSTLNNAKDTYASTLELFESAIVSQSELDASKTGLDQAQVSYDQSLLSLEATKLSYTSAKNSYNEALTNYSLTEKDYIDREDDLFITAPISGLVTDVSVQKDMMNSGSLGVTIVDDTSMILKVTIMEKYIHEIKEGQNVDLILDNNSKEVIGTVTNISLTGQNGYYPVEITIDNSDKALVAGMFTEGYINTNTKSNVIKVKKTTLVQDINDNYYIYTVDTDRSSIIKIPVETGIEDGDYVEIKGSINNGDKIVVIGQDFVNEGQLVTVVN